MRRLLLFLALLLLLGGCAEQETSLGVELEDGFELAYLDGEITFVEDWFEPGETYTENYSENSYSPYTRMAVWRNGLIYSMEDAYVEMMDGIGEIMSLCKDPLCDHTEETRCIVSFGGRNVIKAGTDFYFVYATTVYRYSQETLRTSVFAEFNMMVSSQFLMGRYLYFEIFGQVYVRVDLESNTAMILEKDPMIAPYLYYPYEEMLYFYDANTDQIFRCDTNMQNTQLLAKNVHSPCHTTWAFQLYGDKLYYVSVEYKLPVSESNRPYLCVLDLTTGETERYDGIYCFGICGGTIFYQCYEPREGPLFFNQKQKYVTTTLYTGNRIYRAPLDDIENQTLLTEVTGDNLRLDGYFLHATEDYLYVYISDFSNAELNLKLCRYNLTTGEWQAVE